MIDQNHLENVPHYVSHRITSDVICTRELTSRIAMAKTSFSEKRTLFNSRLDLNLRKKLLMCFT
jgi:hypothetical protein